MLKEKTWSKDMEIPVLDQWKKDNVSAFDHNSKKRVFSIDTPPPYVNAPIHMGHATTYTIMDMIARFRRMIGFNVLFPLGLDRNGLPVEIATEKKNKISMHDTPREKFLELCAKQLEETTTESIDTFFRLGHSYNAWHVGNNPGDMYLTDSDEFRTLTQAVFIDLWNKDLIYEGERINNFCPACKTTIADAEIEYQELPSVFYHIKFATDKGDITVATTRPELLCTCAMILFNPTDDRYKKFEGTKTTVPLFNTTVTIKADPLASHEKGTGLVMMCSMGDQTDIRFFREKNITPKIAINVDNTMNDHAGFLKGLTVKAARETVVQELEKRGLIVKKEKIMHRTPMCERSKTPIEFIVMKELYLKQEEFKADLRKMAHDIMFFEDKSRQILLDWIDAISIDWPISRRRYYGTEIPLWYCKKCSATIVPPKGKYVRPWKEKPPVKKCECGSSDLVGEQRIFDTWFDSSNTPLYILKHGTPFFDKNYPCSLRPQGKEIIRTWLYYTVLKGYHILGKKPFQDAWVHYHVLDDHGKKMSKSLGNTLDPHDILNRYGAEPFRLWCAIEGNITKGDISASFERIEGAGKTITKLWNVCRFIDSFKHVEKRPKKLEATDRWILREINALVTYARKQYEMYDFHTPAVRLRHFLWEVFASHYIELVKNRAYNTNGDFTDDEQQSALFALNECIDTFLKLLAPAVPIVTYKLFKDMRNKDIHKESFPDVVEADVVPFTTDDIVATNSFIWKEKKDRGMSLKAPVDEATVPATLKPIEKDLLLAHTIRKIQYGDLALKW